MRVHEVLTVRKTATSEDALASMARQRTEATIAEGLPLSRLLERCGELRREVIGQALGELEVVAQGTPGAVSLRDEVVRLGGVVDAAVADGIRRYVEQRERRLVTVEERLRLALESAAIGTWDLDVASGTFTLDERCRVIFGLGPGARATYGSFLDQLHREDRERVDALARAALRGSGSYRAEYRIVGPGEGVRWVNAAGSATFDDSGRAVRFIGTAMDVTEEKASEETRERYLGILGHDLREPLASISMTAQQLVRSGQLPAKAARTLDRITRASDRMTRMTRDLVDLARGRLGNLVAHPASADLGAICAAVVEEVQAVHPGRIVQLRTSGSVRCVCDRDRIAQAVTNLLSNALAYGSDPVTVTARGERDEVRVEVRNGGVLHEEERASLFEPFRRGKRARGAKTGLGLGLYIVAQIAKAHGGSVACDAEDRETVFTIRWPRRLPAPP